MVIILHMRCADIKQVGLHDCSPGACYTFEKIMTYPFDPIQLRLESEAALLVRLLHISSDIDRWLEFMRLFLLRYRSNSII